MTPYELAAAVTAAAVSIANCLPDDQLNVAGAAFMQLGDTIATIAAVRQLNDNSVANQSNAPKSTKDTPPEATQVV